MRIISLSAMGASVCCLFFLSCKTRDSKSTAKAEDSADQRPILARIDSCEEQNGSDGCIFDLLRELARPRHGGGPGQMKIQLRNNVLHFSLLTPDGEEQTQQGEVRNLTSSGGIDLDSIIEFEIERSYVFGVCVQVGGGAERRVHLMRVGLSPFAVRRLSPEIHRYSDGCEQAALRANQRLRDKIYGARSFATLVVQRVSGGVKVTLTLANGEAVSRTVSGNGLASDERMPYNRRTNITEPVRLGFCRITGRGVASRVVSLETIEVTPTGLTQGGTQSMRDETRCRHTRNSLNAWIRD